MDRDTESIISHVNDVQAIVDARLKALEKGGEKEATDREYELWGRVIATELLLSQVVMGLRNEEKRAEMERDWMVLIDGCLLYTSPSPRDS